MSTPVNVWSNFSRSQNGQEIRFRIQELHSEKFKDILDLFVNYYVPEEPVHKSVEITQSNEATEEYKEYYLGFALDGHCQIDACCIDDDLGEMKIVGGSIMYLEKKSDPKWDVEEMAAVVKTEEMKKFCKIVSYMCDKYYKDFRLKYNLDLFYDDIGIVVHPDYRGLGIAEELLKARMVISKERGVPMTGAWMTSSSSQKIAAKLGWKSVVEISYTELERIAEVSFKGAPVSAKLMITNV